MHALEQIQRTLKPDGTLFDMRPVSHNWPVEVFVSGETYLAGHIDSTAKAPDDLAADQALEEVVARSLFHSEISDGFEYEYFWDTPQQMQDFISENWSSNSRLPVEVVEEAERLADQDEYDGRIRVRRNMIVGVYRALEG